MSEKTRQEKIEAASRALLHQWDHFEETGPEPSDDLMEALRAALDSDA